MSPHVAEWLLVQHLCSDLAQLTDMDKPHLCRARDHLERALHVAKWKTWSPDAYFTGVNSSRLMLRPLLGDLTVN